MNTLEAVVLGVVQGLTEFLPVSSSGHLVIARELFGLASIPVLFDVLLHVATLVAVVVVLRRQVAAFLVAIGRWIQRRVRDEDRPYLRLVPIVVVTTGITGVIGIVLDGAFDIRNPVVTSGLFLVTAFLLLLTRWSRGSRTMFGISWKDAAILGVAQGFGVLPGISRSGITISAALYSGMDRKTAGEYSFLLSIPAILGALVLTARDMGTLESQMNIGVVLIGCTVAGVVGYAALRMLLRVVQAGKIYLFGLYLVPLGVWGLIGYW
ncbi:MAG: undecaprenyl-diphosphate phosphatase [Alkalispirochaeta sp.]|jgi:undecaprenyl-diphosphatase